MKTIFLILFLAIPAFNSFAQDSTSYFKILDNSEWIYIDIDDQSSNDYYYVWSKRDLKELIFDVLNKNGVNRIQRLNRREQVGMRDMLLEVKIDTNAFLMSFDYVMSTVMLQKMRIVRIELKIKRPVYFTGVNDPYMATVGIKYTKPFIIQLPLYEQNTMDQIIFSIEDLVFDFVKDYKRSKN
jgi:hypothetical protein